MTTRRAPLANVPNAVNSPFRNVNHGSGKRTRTVAGEHREAVYGQPPAKKQIIEIPDDDDENVDPRKRSGVPVPVQDKLAEPFLRRAPNAQPTAFERKLASVRDRRQTRQQPIDPPQKVSEENLESVRQWKRHYRKQFPSFVFYFDSVPDDLRIKSLRQIQALGARDEKFFSKSVTHVITTRAIPPALHSTSPNEDGIHDGTTHPNLKVTSASGLAQEQRKTTNLLDASLQRRAQSQVTSTQQDADNRRLAGADMLSRARELGIRIWASEKLQRVLKTMLETDTGEPAVAQDTRIRVTPVRVVDRPARDADLAQLLRNEKINGPADRDMSVAAQDVVSFTGCYIYVHDMDEKTKPVMARDYDKPNTKEQGKWPQFRLTSAGRCPFVDDPAHTKKLQQQERDAQAAAKAEHELADQRRTRNATAAVAPLPRPLSELESNLRRSPRKAAQVMHNQMSKPLNPPSVVPARRQSSAEGPHLFGSAQPSMRGLPRTIAGEPVASGMQHSNTTSAIRSQVVSSAALSSTAPGMSKRVGDSKEISALKRKVLERGTNVPSNHSMPSSYMNEVRAAINNDDNNPPPRAAKRKAQETLGILHEGNEDSHEPARPVHRRPPAPRKRKPVEKEPKPGYCENCRDKYDDFDDVSNQSHLSELVAQLLILCVPAHQLSQTSQVRGHTRELGRTRCASPSAQASAQKRLILRQTQMTSPLVRSDDLRSRLSGSSQVRHAGISSPGPPKLTISCGAVSVVQKRQSVFDGYGVSTRTRLAVSTAGLGVNTL